MEAGNTNTRKMLVLGVSAFALMGAGFVLAVFFSSMSPSEAVLSDTKRPIKVHLGDMMIGELIKLKWAGSPIIILRRDLSNVAKLPELNSLLSDPSSEIDPDPDYVQSGYRSIKSEYFVAYGYSTHCGCTLGFSEEVKSYMTKIDGGVFFDVCHIATYDTAGRVLAASAEPGPSELLPPRVANLFIPPHRYIADDVILIGEEP